MNVTPPHTTCSRLYYVLYPVRADRLLEAVVPWRHARTRQVERIHRRRSFLLWTRKLSHAV